MISKGLSRPSEKNSGQWIPHLLEEYYASLFALATSIVGPYWAEDVLQEVVIKLIRMGRERFEAKENSIGYLMIMVKNAALAMKKRQRRQARRIPLNGYDRDKDSGQILKNLFEKEQDGLLCTLLGMLKPEEDALIVILFYVEELSHKEIAGMLGITEQNSRTRLSRAKKKLEELARLFLQGDDDPEGGGGNGRRGKPKPKASQQKNDKTKRSGDNGPGEISSSLRHPESSIPSYSVRPNGYSVMKQDRDDIFRLRDEEVLRFLDGSLEPDRMEQLNALLGRRPDYSQILDGYALLLEAFGSVEDAQSFMRNSFEAVLSHASPENSPFGQMANDLSAGDEPGFLYVYFAEAPYLNRRHPEFTTQDSNLQATLFGSCTLEFGNPWCITARIEGQQVNVEDQHPFSISGSNTGGISPYYKNLIKGIIEAFILPDSYLHRKIRKTIEAAILQSVIKVKMPALPAPMIFAQNNSWFSAGSHFEKYLAGRFGTSIRPRQERILEMEPTAYQKFVDEGADSLAFLLKWDELLASVASDFLVELYCLLNTGLQNPVRESDFQTVRECPGQYTLFRKEKTNESKVDDVAGNDSARLFTLCLDEAECRRHFVKAITCFFPQVNLAGAGLVGGRLRPAPQKAFIHLAFTDQPETAQLPILEYALKPQLPVDVNP
ncbi:MAG: sigma-70 family RNA polymerase sigma factor [Phaeodactylibacter sp.]|nr:sigma-70 family RNA polymerase sigma factor [Phaeodactylibacter sp.]